MKVSVTGIPTLALGVVLRVQRSNLLLDGLQLFLAIDVCDQSEDSEQVSYNNDEWSKAIERA